MQLGHFGITGYIGRIFLKMSFLDDASESAETARRTYGEGKIEKQPPQEVLHLNGLE